MSTYLWKYYLEDDVDNFRQLLAAANVTPSAQARTYNAGGNTGTAVGSPGKGLSSSPTLRNKSRISSEGVAGLRGKKGSLTITITRAEINSKDAYGVTLLHRIASSNESNASLFASALLELPLLDMYIQDLESGWTALHRALYFGNVTIARALLDRDLRDVVGHTNGSQDHNFGGLIKIKDREGNSPFEVFGATIMSRIIRPGSGSAGLYLGAGGDEDEIPEEDENEYEEDGSTSKILGAQTCINGDELFTFGSNKNLTLGFGDEDDRQFPERVSLKRPELLLQRFRSEHLDQARSSRKPPLTPPAEKADVLDKALPAIVQCRPIKIHDVQLSKLHTAVLTTDPEANLHICGFGPGGRLGLGDEITRFNFACVYEGGLLHKKIVSVRLGQNHTIAISREGEVFTWGSNNFGQLGYTLPISNGRDQETLQLLPRQIFGPLKRENIIGCAASRIHSVVHTSNSLYTFGKNEGQLGLVDSDARSLEVQTTPRRVAAALFSSAISMVSAMDKATVCLLVTHEVWIFANYGYTKMSFPLDGFSNYFLKSSYATTKYDNTPNHITKITCGGDTICAMARMGDVFTVLVTNKVDASGSGATTSTTNPAKIRSALSAPLRVWSLRKSHMAVRDVDVGQDGSVIICTESGSVWKRIKRTKIKDTNIASAAPGHKPKDYKFSRVPGLTRITAVRSNAFGAFAAVRKDCDVLRTQMEISGNTLWKDLFPLLPFHRLSRPEDSDTEEPAPRLWTPRQASSAAIRHAILNSKDIEQDLRDSFPSSDNLVNLAYDIKIGTTVSDIRIPCHEFIFAGRSITLRKVFQQFRQSYFFSIPEVLSIEYDKDGNTLVLFQGLDILTILNIVLYVYTDSIVDVWNHTRRAPISAVRYRQVRAELLKTSAVLDLRALEQAARVFSEPPASLHMDMESAILEPGYFEAGDVEVELKDSVSRVHSALMCRRCPFFEGLFHGRADGGWLSSRRDGTRETQEAINVDMKHVCLRIFGLVVRHIYADTGEELFDDLVTADFDEFLDLVIEVMSVANELMLDRLAQICQRVLGRFVNTRNVCQLLNAVAPCSVKDFKNAALEYICLNLEGMLENHLLNELDDDLMLELDEIVRENQLASMPFSKSGRAEEELHERNPELAGLIERSKGIKIDSMALQSRLHEDEVKFVASGKTRLVSSGDTTESPIIQPSLSNPNNLLTPSKSPLLKAKASAHDLMFEMDDEVDVVPHKSIPDDLNPMEMDQYDHSDPQSPSSSFTHNVWYNSKGRAIGVETSDSFIHLDPSSPISHASSANRVARDPLETRGTTGKTPWKVGTPSSKFDMRDIMAQASVGRQSNISSALSDQAKRLETAKASPVSKLSQRERKKQMQQQQLQQAVTPSSPRLGPSHPSPTQEKVESPWRVASGGPIISLKDVLQENKDNSSASNSRSFSNPILTMRQTVAGNASMGRRASVEPSTSQQPAQQRSISSPVLNKQNIQGSPSPSMKSRPSPQPRQSQPVNPTSSASSVPVRSIRHNALPVEPPLQLSMADILSQQQTEKDIIKEATAKRSLQEIQEEQAFQEWWDQEEAATRARLLEEEAAAATAGSSSKGERPGRGKSRGRGGRRAQESSSRSVGSTTSSKPSRGSEASQTPAASRGK